MWRLMPSRVGSLVGAAILAASLLGATAVPAAAANTRVTYFGSAACPAGLGTCPTAPASAAAYPYPYGTGGGFTASGQPIAGQNSFTAVTAGSSTATDIVIENVAPSTLTQVHFTGGSQAPNPINAGSVPAMPGSIDPALCSSTGACLSSLPAGLFYQAVYVVANPSGIRVACSLSATPSVPAGLSDGLSCSIGNLASLQGVTLRVVLAATAPTTTPLEPWFTLQLKEGSSLTGSNSDAFLTYGLLSVAAPSCDTTSNFFLDGTPVSLSNIALQCAQTTKVETANGFANGVLATVGSTPSALCVGNLSCFGQLSTSSILAGASIPGGVTWSIRWSASLVPPGGPKGAIHFLDAYPANPGAYETISFKSKDRCGSTLVRMCWLAFTANADGSYAARIWTPSNGSIRGN
jgi:hypothetical protein